MKHVKKQTYLSADLNGDILEKCSRPLFLDIETTGFSPERSHIYLIGCCYPMNLPDGGVCIADWENRMEDKSVAWEFHQWFAENAGEEKAVLEAFADFVRGFSLLVTFNGDTFDLPYLTKRAGKYGIALHLEEKSSLDLFKSIRTCKNLLHTPDLKLKTLEKFLGIHREDEYSGGQLIEVYKEQARKPDPEKERLLLLHNEEDILHIPDLLPILRYPAFLEGKYRVTEVVNAELSRDGIFTVDLRLDLSVPRSVFFHDSVWNVILRDDLLHLSCPIVMDEMKAYFPDHRNYYYLPEEDMAIHRSVAEFVEKDHRKRATKETAYVRKDGVFLPIPTEWEGCGRIYRQDYREAPHLDLEQLNMADLDFWKEYVTGLTSGMQSHKNK